ncbi:MAG: site-specific recombinase [Solirubrobacteraceae bacterium]|nr:site-specific recombinase [Solirubrobacteraceae bacterium]
MEPKHLEGGTRGPARLGYLNVKETIEDRQIASVAIDPERAPLIRMAFDLAATGRHTIRSITEILDEAGLRSRATPARASQPLNIAIVHLMLRSDYYLGIVTHGATNSPAATNRSSTATPSTAPKTFWIATAPAAAAAASTTTTCPASSSAVPAASATATAATATTTSTTPA